MLNLFICTPIFMYRYFENDVRILIYSKYDTFYNEYYIPIFCVFLHIIHNPAICGNDFYLPWNELSTVF